MKKEAKGLPKLKFEKRKICGDYQIGKKTKMSHKKLKYLTTSKVHESLHMELMGAMQVESLGGKTYVFMCVDDFSRYIWINFIREKFVTLDVFKDLCQRLQREKGSGILKIKSDHGKEF